MGIGHDIWHVGGIKRPWVWDMDNIKVGLEEIEKRSLNLAEDRKDFDEFSGDIQCGKFLE
jgi:hypothetical protein